MLSKANMQLASEVLKLKKEVDYWQSQAMADALTGLGNRRAFDKDLLDLWSLCKRKNENISILYFDLDGLKACNDNHGHDYGDQFIKQVGYAVESCIRQYDKASRWGGDEFAIILPMTSATESMVIAERIRLMITSLRDADGRFYGTASIGVASSPAALTTPDRLVSDADLAQKKAKQLGKNKVCKLD